MPHLSPSGQGLAKAHLHVHRASNWYTTGRDQAVPVGSPWVCQSLPSNSGSILYKESCRALMCTRACVCACSRAYFITHVVCLAVLCRGCEVLEGRSLALAVFVPLRSPTLAFPQGGSELSLRARRHLNPLVQSARFIDRFPR